MNQWKSSYDKKNDKLILIIDKNNNGINWEFFLYLV